MCKKLSTLLKQKRWLMLTAGLLVIVLLLAAFAPIVPFAKEVSFEPGEESMRISDYTLSRMTDFALIRTIYQYPTLLDIGLVGYENYKDRDGNGVEELERRFMRNPAGILIKGNLFLLWEKWTGAKEENFVNYESLRGVFLGMCYKLHPTAVKYVVG